MRRLPLSLIGTSLLVAISAAIASPGQAATPADQVSTSGTVWLCQPGANDDPCAFSPVATALEANGSTKAATLAVGPLRSKFDCFYVYPTVSTQATDNSNLDLGRAEIDAAIGQASLFSQVCNVWAPMYRQVTLTGVAQELSGNESDAVTNLNVAYQSLLSGWNAFLARSDGRPIILIGHSQGSAMLIRLISTQLDHQPAILRRLVVAIIAGGNLQLPTGKAVGATFNRVPVCTKPAQTGCAIAYSSFPSTPPSDSLFGRPGQGVSLMSGQLIRQNQEVACVNPAAVGGGTADLSPYFVTVAQSGLKAAIATPWVTYPDLYSATCEHQAGVTWLQVTSLEHSGDTRPVVQETLGPTWGYHLEDINLALGSLVVDVARDETAWEATHK